MSDFKRFDLTLKPHQFTKLKNGHMIQLAAEQLHGNRHHIMVHPHMHQKMSHAKKRKKGVRIAMTSHEMQASGAGLKEFLDKIKQGFRFVKDKIIDTPVYQQAVKPVVRQLVNTGMSMAAPHLGPAAPIANDIVNKIGEQTGAYGMRRRVKQPKIEATPLAYPHEAWPAPLTHSHSMIVHKPPPLKSGKKRVRGGSFRAI